MSKSSSYVTRDTESGLFRRALVREREVLGESVSKGMHRGGLYGAGTHCRQDWPDLNCTNIARMCRDRLGSWSAIGMAWCLGSEYAFDRKRAYKSADRLTVSSV